MDSAYFLMLGKNYLIIGWRICFATFQSSQTDIEGKHVHRRSNCKKLLNEVHSCFIRAMNKILPSSELGARNTKLLVERICFKTQIQTI